MGILGVSFTEGGQGILFSGTQEAECWCKCTNVGACIFQVAGASGYVYVIVVCPSWKEGGGREEGLG